MTKKRPKTNRFIEPIIDHFVVFEPVETSFPINNAQLLRPIAFWSYDGVGASEFTDLPVRWTKKKSRGRILPKFYRRTSGSPNGCYRK